MVESVNHLALQVTPLGAGRPTWVIALRVLLLASFFPITDWFLAVAKTGNRELILAILLLVYAQVIALIMVLFQALPFLLAKKGRAFTAESELIVRCKGNDVKVGYAEIKRITLRTHLGKRLVLSLHMQDNEMLEYEVCDHYLLFGLMHGVYFELNYFKAFSFIMNHDALSSRYTD
jgi:hypothetical protein